MIASNIHVVVYEHMFRMPPEYIKLLNNKYKFIHDEQSYIQHAHLAIFQYAYWYIGRDVYNT